MQAQIQKRIDLINKSLEEQSTKKEILEDGLLGDEEYNELKDRAKTAQDRFKAHREALLNEPENRKLVSDLKDLAQEIKDEKELLSGELVAYFMENQTLEFTDANGVKRVFKVNAQIKKQKGV